MVRTGAGSAIVEVGQITTEDDGSTPEHVVAFSYGADLATEEGRQFVLSRLSDA